jgi:hypothetical protein
MPKATSLSKVTIKGNKQERELFAEKIQHYEMARDDLNVRITDWDRKDELFRSHIDTSDWPYNSVVFDPRTFTAIFEKTSRLLANKPRGRMVPREGGDSLGAKINNELLSFQWDDNERADGSSMLAKWAMMDQNTRKYGAGFALCKWRYDTTTVKEKDKKGNTKYKKTPFYDGPDFKVLCNRDVLANPSYSTIKNWFAYREYVTLAELENVNDAARVEPVYKNLDILRDSIKQKELKNGDTRATNWTSKNKSVKGLEDYLGQDISNKTIEVVTEYSQDKWVSYAPHHGVILRDITNPYDHGQIPVVMMKYYSVDDDLYGLSELEPVERLQKAINALVCQYLDSINMSLYVPLKIRATGVQMHTIEFGPGKKWIMNDPTSDVVPHVSPGTGVNEFASTYRFLVGALQEGLGETSAMTSNLNAGGKDKTATEIKDLAVQRNARDNFNQIFLSEAIKRQMMLWHLMDRQFMFSDPTQKQKIIRVVGKDAIRYFENKGLGGDGISEEAAKTIEGSDDDVQSLIENGVITLQDLAQPNYPVEMGGETVPKFYSDGDTGHLIIEKEDLAGNYDYIPDVESMKLPDDGQTLAAKKQMIELMMNPATAQMLMVEGYKIKSKELFEDFFEQLGMKDADKYFTKEENALQTGNGPLGPSNPGQGNVPNAGMVPNQGPVGGQAGPSVPGSSTIPVR